MLAWTARGASRVGVIATVLIAVTACVLMLVASIAYYSRLGDLWDYAPVRVWQLGLREGGLVCFVVGAGWLRATMDSGRIAARHYVLFLVLLAWAGFSTRMWLEWPMHDIALFWDNHGRWGCHDESHILTDRTLPYVLFGPALFAIAAHAGCAARGRHGLPNPALQPTPQSRRG